MIDPTEEDIGRAVVYTGNRFPGGKLEEVRTDAPKATAKIPVAKKPPAKTGSTVN